MAALVKQVGGRALSYISVRRGRPPASYESVHGTTKRYAHARLFSAEIVIKTQCCAVLCGLLSMHAVAAAQTRSDSGAAVWDVAPYIGVAQHSPVGYDWGATADRSHLFLGIHLRTPVVRVAQVQIFYAPTITPLLRLSHDRPAGSSEAKERTAYAIGFAPFGLAVGFPISATVRAYGSTAVGALWFNRVVPTTDARAFNVSLEWGGSLEWSRTPSTAIELGYRFHHLSNVYSAIENPGVDANMFYIGHRWRRAVRR